MAKTGAAGELAEVPGGYTPAILMSDSTMGLMCNTCGANVSWRNTALHDAWHQRLDKRIGDVERRGA